MQVSIIIPSKDRTDILIHSLQYLLDATQNITAEILVVNDSKNEIVLPEHWKNRIRIIKNPKNGVASARNLGAQNASSELLLFMDDDMLVNEKAMLKTVELCTTYPDNTINMNWIYPPDLLTEIKKTKFGRYLYSHGFTSLKGWNKGQPWNEEAIFENIGVTSQFLAMHKKTFMLVNGYDETFPHAGYEDYDFAKRLHQKGVRFYVWPKDIIYHNETDRHELSSWLARKQRGGATRKHAVLRGNQELKLKFTGVKKIILLFMSFTKNFWITSLNLLPNTTSLDFFYGKIVNILLATSIFEGYTSIRD